ncbi:MAG: LysR substrate-binding domain-containing protein, partial [Parvularcula sp.]|nr:LysR substrate-binding domain-containing protein [Parvularcula sp.]
AGMGRTVLPVPLVEGAIERGQLKALDEAVESRRAYWLVAPVPQWRSKKVKALVQYLTSE